MTFLLFQDNVDKKNIQKSKDIKRPIKPQILKTVNVLGKKEVLEDKINCSPDVGRILIPDSKEENKSSKFAKNEFISKECIYIAKRRMKEEILLARLEQMKSEFKANKNEDNPKKHITEDFKEDKKCIDEFLKLRTQKIEREEVSKFKKINRAVKVIKSNDFNYKNSKKRIISKKNPSVFQNINPRISKLLLKKNINKIKPRSSINEEKYKTTKKPSDMKNDKQKNNIKVSQETIANTLILKNCSLNCRTLLNNEFNETLHENNMDIDYNKNVYNKFPKFIENFNENPIKLPKKVDNLENIKTRINVNKLTDLRLASVLGGRKYINSFVLVKKLSDSDYNKYSKSLPNYVENNRCIIVDKSIKDRYSDNSEDEDIEVDGRSYNNLTTEEIYSIIGENYILKEEEESSPMKHLIHLVSLVTLLGICYLFASYFY